MFCKCLLSFEKDQSSNILQIHGDDDDKDHRRNTVARKRKVEGGGGFTFHRFRTLVRVLENNKNDFSSSQKKITNPPRHIRCSPFSLACSIVRNRSKENREHHNKQSTHRNKTPNNIVIYNIINFNKKERKTRKEQKYGGRKQNSCRWNLLFLFEC